MSSIFKRENDMHLRLKMYEQMYLIRLFEEKMEELFKKGALFGTIHSCAGQEAVAVGIINSLSQTDLIIGNHRSHGHYLAYTNDVEGLMAELMGKATGVVGGRGGSQHIHKNNFYSNGVQGGMVPVATGMALAEKIKKSGNIVVCFIGDGTLGQGVVYESMNIASLWQLPILYVVENNYYAMSTRICDAVAGLPVNRGRAFDIESSELTSNDSDIIYNGSEDIVKKVREKCTPYFWVINTYRLSGHSKSDDRCYRTKEEEMKWAELDPLLIAESKIPRELRLQIEHNCMKRIEDTAEKVKKDVLPSKEGLADMMKLTI